MSCIKIQISLSSNEQLAAERILGGFERLSRVEEAELGRAILELLFLLECEDRVRWSVTVTTDPEDEGERKDGESKTH